MKVTVLGSLDRIRDERLRAAARRYEEATGESLAGIFGPRLDEGTLGVFLIVNGYFNPLSPNGLPADTPDKG